MTSGDENARPKTRKCESGGKGSRQKRIKQKSGRKKR